MIVCLHEDRPAALVGVQLALLSVLRHAPGQRVLVSCPDPPAPFVDWLAGKPGVELLSDRGLAGLGYDTKPILLRRLLDDGHEDVLWLDTDIVATRDFRSLFPADPRVLVVAEEVHLGQEQGSAYRTRAWGLRVGRELPLSANTGVLRVTTEHRRLLDRWAELLGHPDYRRAQALQPSERPLYVLADQEVLTALLGSDEFAAVPVVMLRRGRAVAQCYGPAGFTPADRVRSLARGLPAFVHALGWVKPWEKSGPKRIGAAGTGWRAGARAQLDLLHLELSPYAALARSYAAELNGGGDWLRVESRSGRALARLFRGSPALQELPLSVADAARQGIRARARRGRFPLDWPA